MSQTTVSQLNAGKPANVLWYGSAGKADTGQAPAQSFDQKLLSMLLGNTQPQEGQASAQLLTLGGLLGNVDAAQTEGSKGTLTEAIEGLLQQLPKLDEALQEDPSLMVALQGWLQNIQTLIPQVPTAMVGDMTITSETSALPALAQHPETMRFAVQDALVQLLAASKSDVNVVGSTQTSVGAMLDSLQGLLDTLPDPNESKPANPKFVEHASTQPRTIVSDQGAGTNQQGNSGQNGEMLKNGNLPSVQNTNPKTDTSQTQFTVNAVHQAVDDANAPDRVTTEPTEHEEPLQAGSIVTAGQLVIRDNGVMPVKHAAKPVPVDNFGKEMSGFLVNKLEIVKLQGVSEARISLYPEHLGQVDVRITMQNGQLTAQFMTEHAFAKESLEQQMAQLRSALQSQGLQVSKLEVSQNSALSSHMYHDGRQSGGGTGQQPSEKRRQLAEEEALAIHDMNDEWNEWIAEVRAKEQGYGSSFIARA
ncbi:flagellar hook-length control protein FliK [Paenibacillus macerans]|uniref:flagellar hook-length control protein FliK n=1 Tax=Paenibacillus macerans TaxID=44252 RepID=UPI003D31F40B